MGGKRPLGIAAVDKTVQQTVVTILNQIYEEDFSASRMVFVQDVASIKRWM